MLAKAIQMTLLMGPVLAVPAPRVVIDALDIEGLAHHPSPGLFGRGDAVVDVVDRDIAEPMGRHTLEVLALHFE